MRYAAFLRAINVGGRNVKMEALRQHFTDLGLTGVETHIASGNVIFETTAPAAPDLPTRIAAHLRTALGFEVDTFVRGADELRGIAAYQPFDPAALEGMVKVNVAFLNAPPAAAAQHNLLALADAANAFHIHGREVYWLIRTRESESTFSNAALEKTLGMRATLRGMNTVRQMVEKYFS